MGARLWGWTGGGPSGGSRGGSAAGGAEKGEGDAEGGWQGRRPGRSLSSWGGAGCRSGSQEGEDALGSCGASGSASNSVASCSFAPTPSERGAGTSVPFQRGSSPAREEGPPYGVHGRNFTFQSGKVPLGEEGARERSCLRPRRRHRTPGRGPRGYVHLKPSSISPMRLGAS